MHKAFYFYFLLACLEHRRLKSVPSVFLKYLNKNIRWPFQLPEWHIRLGWEHWTLESDLGTKVHASVISDTTEIILKRMLYNKSSIGTLDHKV